MQLARIQIFPIKSLEHSINGLKYIPLSQAGRCFNLQPIKVTVPRSRRGSEHYHHDGENGFLCCPAA